MTAPHSLIRRVLMVTVIMGFTVAGGLAADSTSPTEITETLSPLQAQFQNMTGGELFAKLVEHNRLRDLNLEHYSAVRTYRVTNDKGKVYAQEVVRVDYQAPDHKWFVIDSEEGSWMVRDLVLNRLIESESETSSGSAHRDSSIKPANYEFRPLGEQDLGPYHCLVVEARPRRRDKYLFDGRIWIDTKDYAMVRIAGQPAQKLSFWITRADFVRQYRKIGQFWLPARDETVVHLRLNGKKILTIDHRDYTIDRASNSAAPDIISERQTNGQ